MLVSPTLARQELKAILTAKSGWKGRKEEVSDWINCFRCLCDSGGRPLPLRDTHTHAHTLIAGSISYFVMLTSTFTGLTIRGEALAIKAQGLREIYRWLSASCQSWPFVMQGSASKEQPWKFKFPSVTSRRLKIAHRELFLAALCSLKLICSGYRGKLILPLVLKALWLLSKCLPTSGTVFRYLTLQEAKAGHDFF